MSLINKEVTTKDRTCPKCGRYLEFTSLADCGCAEEVKRIKRCHNCSNMLKATKWCNELSKFIKINDRCNKCVIPSSSPLVNQ